MSEEAGTGFKGRGHSKKGISWQWMFERKVRRRRLSTSSNFFSSIFFPDFRFFSVFFSFDFVSVLDPKNSIFPRKLKTFLSNFHPAKWPCKLLGIARRVTKNTKSATRLFSRTRGVPCPLSPKKTILLKSACVKNHNSSTENSTPEWNKETL